MNVIAPNAEVMNNTVYPLLGWVILLLILAPFFIASRRVLRRQRLHFQRMAEHMERVEQQLERIAQSIERPSKGV
jgi:hypothetical protein